MLATVLFVVLIMLVSSTPVSADTTALVGKPSPDFPLTTLDGKAAKLSAQKGNAVVICFWNSGVVYARSLLFYPTFSDSMPNRIGRARASWSGHHGR